MWHTDSAATPTIRWLLTVLLRLPASPDHGALRLEGWGSLRDPDERANRASADPVGLAATRVGLAAQQAACERWRGARPKAARVPTGPEEQPGWLVDRLELEAAVVQKLRSRGYTQ